MRLQRSVNTFIGLLVLILGLFINIACAADTINNTNITTPPLNTQTSNTLQINANSSPQNPFFGDNASLNLSGNVGNSPGIFTKDIVTGQEYVADQVIVRFKSQKTDAPSISNAKIEMVHAKVGAKVKKDFSSEGLSGLQLVQLANGTDVQSAIKEYQLNPDVLYAEPDYVITIPPDQTGAIIQDAKPLQILATTPNDSFFSELWGLHNTGQTVNEVTGTSGADINATTAWDITTGSNNVIVAVVDTGVLYTHNDLSANIWTNPGEIPGNGIDDDHNGYIDDVHGWNFITNTSDPLDDNGHGTHVSGTIGAVGNNGIGVAGVNWQVKIMVLKAFDASGSGDTFNAVSAILYANANGASVISNSWSGPDFSQALKDAIDASPAVVICAAGNDGLNNDVTTSNKYPASFTSSNIISVAATDQNDQLASFSNYGPVSVDLAAPGVNILSVNITGAYGFMDGTSMATPHVSGVAALVKSVNQTLTAIQIKNIILSTVDAKGSLSGNVSTGGRLDAYKAIAATPIAPLTTTSKIGIYQNGLWYLDMAGTGNPATSTFYYFGAPGYSPVTGDWNGDGKTEIGIYANGAWYLDKEGTGNPATSTFYYFGAPGYSPVTGDWNGDGKTEIGIYANGGWYVDKVGTGNPATATSYSFGASGWTSVIGKWT